MFYTFSPLLNFIKSSSTVIDNTIFRLHYKFTTTLLISCALLITARQYFGDPISCLQRDGIPPMDTYCWIHSTFSIEGAWKKRVGAEVPYPGIDRAHRNSESRVYHRYYQWVWLVLFLQAIVFYFPHYLWKRFEAGLTESLTEGLVKPILNEPTKYEALEGLIEFLQRSRAMGLSQKMYYRYLACEALNLINVIGQILLTDRFLGGRFLGYGAAVLEGGWTTWRPLEVDPMMKVFPRVAKCEYYQFGKSSEVEVLDTLCVLPLNILNEKIYLILWFWFYILAIASVLMLQYRVMLAFLPLCQTLSLQAHCKALSRKVIVNVTRSGRLGDWFLLQLLAKNLPEMHFYDLMIHLERELTEEKQL